MHIAKSVKETVQKGFIIKRECDWNITTKMYFYASGLKHLTPYGPDLTKKTPRAGRFAKSRNPWGWCGTTHVQEDTYGNTDTETPDSHTGTAPFYKLCDLEKVTKSKCRTTLYLYASQMTCKSRESGQEGISVLPPHLLRKLSVLTKGAGESTWVLSITHPTLPQNTRDSWRPHYKQPKINTTDKRHVVTQTL